MFEDNDFKDVNLEHNEIAVNKAIEYLSHHDPENANRDYAIGLLHKMQMVAVNIANHTEMTFEQFIDTVNKDSNAN